jgi:hypothetical protein
MPVHDAWVLKLEKGHVTTETLDAQIQFDLVADFTIEEGIVLLVGVIRDLG